MTATSVVLKYLSDNNNIVNQNMETPQRAKKKRLDHLTWEEKLQRKKLKNRVAAQTSRDRKKAKLEQMEQAIQELFAKNEELTAECENLKNINERLSLENAELQNRISQPCSNCVAQNRTVEYENGSSGSAESLLQPKGTVTYSAAALSNTRLKVLLKILLACHLYQISLMNSTVTQTSTATPSNSLHKVSSKISPETWRKLLKNQLVKNKNLVQKWWGSHQNHWNPVEVKS